MCFAVHACALRNKVNMSARGPYGPATNLPLSISVSVTLRPELFEFRFKGELFQFDVRELQIALLFQLPPKMLRIYISTLYNMLLKPIIGWLRDAAPRNTRIQSQRGKIPTRRARAAKRAGIPIAAQEAAIRRLIVLTANT